MKIDWSRLLSQHGIEYTAQRENYYLSCPFCGTSDQGQHLAISLLGRGWRCFRNPTQHRGRSYVRLVSALLRCSDAHAKELLGEDAPIALPAPDEFSSQWRKQLGLAKTQTTATVTKLSFPREFKPLSTSKSPFAGIFWQYVQRRGYTYEQARWAASAYGMHYATTGSYAYRLILPIYDSAGKLMTWTGRSTKADAQVRYMSLAASESLTAPGNLLLGLPLLWKAEPAACLVICEGPFDAVAISTLGHRYGVWGACLFGVNVSEAQADLLDALERRFPRMRLLIDPDANLKVLNLRQRLPTRCKSTPLMSGLKDPGELVSAGAAGVEFVKSLAA